MSEPFAEKVDDLVSSIDDLEDVLGPLFETPLSRLTTQLTAPLDRAKLQAWLSYVLNDLVWILLKTRGINPSHLDSGELHDVVAELDRVKGYFAKIKEAENPAKRSLTVDGKVANRFIKHALASAISPANFASSSDPRSTHIRFGEDGAADQPSVPGPSSKPEPVAATSDDDSESEPEAGTWKAKKRAREEDLANQRVAQESESEEEAVLIWEEADAKPVAPMEQAEEEVVLVKEEAEPSVEASSGAKRRRMDPFAGYGDSVTKPSKRSTTITQSSTASSTTISQPTNFPQSSSLPPPSGTLSSATPPIQVPKAKKKVRRGTSHSRHKKNKGPKEDASAS